MSHFIFLFKRVARQKQLNNPTNESQGRFYDLAIFSLEWISPQLSPLLCSIHKMYVKSQQYWVLPPQRVGSVMNHCWSKKPPHRNVHTPSTLHCTALHCTALHCTALHCTALHCTAPHFITRHYPALNAPHWYALHCTVLHCTALNFTIQHCIALHWSELSWLCFVVLLSGEGWPHHLPPPSPLGQWGKKYTTLDLTKLYTSIFFINIFLPNKEKHWKEYLVLRKLSNGDNWNL